MKKPWLTPQIFLPVALLVLAGIVLIGRNFANVKDMFVSVTSSAEEMTASPSATAASTPVASASSGATVTPTPIATAVPQTSQTSNGSSAHTSVTVNGKSVPADQNGNVDYHENGVNVHVNNSSTSQQTQTSQSSTNTSVTVTNQ